ncbi:alpha/beta hydrolase [Chromobacterium haemolyticum]|nr:alpha/beta hydrolase [Chromobacterium haemolyticum]
MEPSLADFDLIIQPGWHNSGPRHWQSHWQRRLKAERAGGGKRLGRAAAGRLAAGPGSGA